MYDFNPQNILLSIPGIFLAISLHSFFQANSAKKLGDDTPEKNNRLTLSPIPHIDIMGLILLILFNFGWPKHIDINIKNLKNKQKHPVLIFLSGPMINFAVAIIFILLIKVLYITNVMNLLPIYLTYAFEKLFLITAKVNLSLFIFTLLPIYPLSGYFSLYYIIPHNNKLKLYRFQRFSRLILLTIIVLPISNLLISPIVENIIKGLCLLLKLNIFI